MKTQYQPDLSAYPEPSRREYQKQLVVSDLTELCHEALTDLLTAQVIGNITDVARAKKNLDVIFMALELTDDLRADVTARKLAGKI